MERETGIEPALVAWKATVLPLNYSRPGVLLVSRLNQIFVDQNLFEPSFSSVVLNPPPTTPIRKKFWWREVDSNHRRHEPADLQSAPVGRLGIPPRIPVLLPLLTACRPQNYRRREKPPDVSACRFIYLGTHPHGAAYCRFWYQFLSRRHEKC